MSVRLTKRLTVEQDIRETTEAIHGKLSDERWNELWTDLLLYQEYGPRLQIDVRGKPTTPTSAST